jgi:micrococcal nuclease
VLDGDTILLDGIHMRLKGVAALKVAHFENPGEPGGEAAKAFMVELAEGHVVVGDLMREQHTLGRRVGWCHRDGRDVGAALIKAGLARDCPRFSGGRYKAVKRPEAASLPFPGYCRLK